MKQRKKTERRFTPVRNAKHLMQNLAGHGDKVVYRYYDETDRNLLDMTYAEFVEMTRAEAAAFAEMGLVGKRIAIIGETSPKWVSTYLATLAGGSVAIPMDKELAFDEILSFLAVAEADAVVYSKSFGERFAAAAGNHPTVRYFIPMTLREEDQDREGIVSLDSLVERGRALTDYTFPEPEDTERMAEMLFTSGTTGTSKCVMLCEKNIISVINAACESVEFFPEDTIVSVLPIHHTYELACMISGMNYGMTIGINDSLKRVLKNFATFRPTGLVLVPLFVETIYKRIWDEAKKKGKDGTLRFGIKLSRFLRVFGIDIRRKLFGEVLAAFGGRLERIVSGGAPLNPKLVRAFDDFGITIMEGYGITECSPLISVSPYYAIKTGSVGPAVPCCEVRIDGDRINEKGFCEGEIIVKGDNVMLGYYANEAANADAFTEEGWYRTGDVGYMDKDRYIYITGRKKSVIVLDNGKNVFPEEIEEYLSGVAGVLESVVVGRKGEAGDVVLTAIIVPDSENDAIKGKPAEEAQQGIRDQIREMNKKLASFKQIKAVEFRAEPFEKTTSRKIKRHLVK